MRWILAAILTHSACAQITPSAAYFDKYIAVSFGVSQLDEAKLSNVKSFGFVYDKPSALQIPIKIELSAQRPNELTVKLFCLEPTPESPSAVPLDPTGLDPASSKCMKLNPIAAGKSTRFVAVYLEGVAFLNEEKPFTQLITVPLEIGTVDIYKPDAALPKGRTLPLGLSGIKAPEFIAALTPKLGQIKVTLDFAKADSAQNVEVSPVKIEPHEKSQILVNLILPFDLPRRPEDFSIKVSIPESVFQGTGIAVTRDLAASYQVPKTTFPAVDEDARKKAMFFVDATYRSFVDPTVNKGNRRNSGLFAYGWRPIIPFLVKGQTSLALRPQFGANISTDPLRELVKSGAPTQLQHGLDLELIRNHFKDASTLPLLAQSIMGFGVRHESDRDFKFQTIFGRFSYSPVFRGWTQSREYRLTKAPKGKAPTVSMWSVTPTVSYDIGSVVRDRLQRLVPFPLITDELSRLNVEFASEVEFRRAVKLSVKDTFSHLWSLPRRPDRNFLSTALEVNSGFLFRTSPLTGFQNALVFKFERGEQTPTYKPVNTFSVGFKVYL